MSTITGTWSTEMNTPFGKQNLVITLEPGDPPRGTMESPDGRTDVEDVVLTEDTVRFTMPLERPIKATSVWSLTADGDRISGTMKAGFFPATKLTGTRVVEDASA